MAKAIAGLAILATLAIAACATTGGRGYVICNDMAPNTTCPDNTANVVVGM
jgi:hypothetical protein